MKSLLLVLLFALPLCAQVLTVPNGGTGKGTLAVHGPLIGNGTAPITVGSPGVAGWCYISGGPGVDPSFQACPAGTVGNQAANTVYGNFTGSSAAPTFAAIAACGDATHALSYVAGTGFSCQTLSGGGITSINGNTTAAQVITGTAPITVNSVAGITTVACPTCGVSGGAALSQITAATATNSINNASFAQTWNWVLTGANNGMVIGEGSAGAGTGALVQINGLSNGVTPLDVEESAANVAQVHLGTTSTNGVWFLANVGGLQTGAGAQYVPGTGWVARGTGPTRLIQDASAGTFNFAGNTGQTPGSTFTPTTLETISPMNGRTVHILYAGGNPYNAIDSGNTNIDLAQSATFDGSGWTARTATPSILSMVNGVFGFFSDTGKTVNATYSPTQIGSFAPAGLSVFGTVHTTGNLGGVTPISPGVGGITMGWNGSGGLGEGTFVNNTDGGSTGGFSFMMTPSAGTPITNLLYMTSTAGSTFIGSPTANGLLLGGGVHVAAAQYIADVANPSMFQLNTDGYLRWFIDTGKTPGTAYSPTQIAYLASNGTIVLSGVNTVNSTVTGTESAARLAVTGGVSSGAGMQHKRFTSCTTTAVVNGTCTGTMLWYSAFPDTAYDAVCGQGAIVSGQNTVVDITSKTTTGINYQVTNGPGGSAASTVEVNCMAMHD